MIPERFETRVVADVADFKFAVQQAAVFAREMSNNVRLEFATKEENEHPYEMAVSGISDEIGDSRSVVSLPTLEGEPNRIAFNVRYVQDALNAIGSDQVVIEMSNPSSPGVFKAADADDFIHVVMPMYVTWNDQGKA